MKATVGILLALALVVSAAGVWAADIEGKIQSVDTNGREIVLDDGTRLSMAEGLAMDNLREGAKVKASYEERDGRNIVTGIEVSD